MTIQSLNQPRMLFLSTQFSAGSALTTTLDTTDDWIAWLFYWPGGDLTKAAFSVGTCVGSPVLTVQLFQTDTSDATATPVLTGSAIGSAVDTAALSTNNIAQASAIGQTSLAEGIYALRAIFKSGTSCAVIHAWGGSGVSSSNYQFPFVVTVANAGAQTKTSPLTGALHLSLGNASAWVHTLGLMPAAQWVATANFISTGNPDEFGIWFTNPYPYSIRLSGIIYRNNTGTRPDLRLAYYTGSLASPTQVFTQVFDRDLAVSNTNGGNILPISNTNKPTLASGATAGIGIRAATAQNMTMHYLDFLTGNEAIMDSWWGQNATLFTRENDAGALTQTTFQTPLLNPIFDGIDVGAASAAHPIFHPGMSGGLNA